MHVMNRVKQKDIMSLNTPIGSKFTAVPQCPYCEVYDPNYADTDKIYDSSEFKVRCKECHKQFYILVYVTTIYTTKKA